MYMQIASYALLTANQLSILAVWANSHNNFHPVWVASTVMILIHMIVRIVQWDGIDTTCKTLYNPVKNALQAITRFILVKITVRSARMDAQALKALHPTLNAYVHHVIPIVLMLQRHRHFVVLGNFLEPHIMNAPTAQFAQTTSLIKYPPVFRAPRANI